MMLSKESPLDEVLQLDIESVVGSSLSIEELKEQTVLITGATGLIGSQLVKLLCCYNRIQNKKINIIACVRNEDKASKVFGELLESPYLSLEVGDINDGIQVEGEVDYIIHGASATSSKYFVTNPVETILTAIDGTNHILRLAKEKQVKGFVYLSSLEVYGVPDKDGYITESDYGYIDPLSIRSSYSEGKRMVECLCISYGHQYHIPVKIARLSQTFGAGVDYNDGRVFAEFARCAMENRNIILKTAGNTVRSYCYSADALSAILLILQKGVSGEAYNVTNMNTIISIKDMAQLVCDIFKDSQIQVQFEIPDDLASFGFNPEMVIKLDSRKLMELGWEPQVALEEMFTRLVKSMKQ